MHKNDQKNDRNRIMTSLQKKTALQYQKKVGIPALSPGLIKHILLYENALQIGITVISACGGNKRVYKSNNYYHLQIAVFHTRRK